MRCLRTVRVAKFFSSVLFPQKPLHHRVFCGSPVPGVCFFFCLQRTQVPFLTAVLIRAGGFPAPFSAHFPPGFFPPEVVPCAGRHSFWMSFPAKIFVSCETAASFFFSPCEVFSVLFLWSFPKVGRLFFSFWTPCRVEPLVAPPLSCLGCFPRFFFFFGGKVQRAPADFAPPPPLGCTIMRFLSPGPHLSWWGGGPFRRFPLLWKNLTGSYFPTPVV